VGYGLAKKGVTDYYSVDFVAVQRDTKYDIYALEINLRKGKLSLCDNF
jgi:hypothetical protein